MSINAEVPYEPLQTALYALLDGAIRISTDDGGLEVKVYDEIPPEAPFPYAVIAAMDDVIFEARGVQGKTVRVTMHVFSRESGGKFEVYRIMDEISKLWTAGVLTITGWSDVQKSIGPTRAEPMDKEQGTYVGFLPLDIIMVQT